MGVARVTRSHARDCKGKGQGNVHRIAVCAEADFATSETLEGSERRIVSGLPRIPDLKRSLPLIDVTSPFHSVTPVNLMTTVAAIAADEAIQAGSDCGHRVFRFDEYPNLDHVSGFPIVAGGFEAGGDDHPLGVFVDNVAVAHREPPTINSAKQ